MPVPASGGGVPTAGIEFVKVEFTFITIGCWIFTLLRWHVAAFGTQGTGHAWISFVFSLVASDVTWKLRVFLCCHGKAAETGIRCRINLYAHNTPLSAQIAEWYHDVHKNLCIKTVRSWVQSSGRLMPPAVKSLCSPWTYSLGTGPSQEQWPMNWEFSTRGGWAKATFSVGELFNQKLLLALTAWAPHFQHREAWKLVITI